MNILNQIALTLQTVRHFKLKQALYQVYYRTFPRRVHLDCSGEYFLTPLTINSPELIKSTGKYFPPDFVFLNVSKSFSGGKVNYSFQDFGKLWNYNLQYFDYLHDPTISDSLKLSWINDFNDQLGEIKLESYPVSIRLVNWILFCSRVGFSEKITRSIISQFTFLRRNLEYHLMANHLIENYIAIFFVAASLNDGKLLAESISQIRLELEEQVLSDGGHYERSPMYHCILLSRLLLIVDVSGSSQLLKFANEIGAIRTVAQRMLSWLWAIRYENDSLPHFNDSTDEIAPTPTVLFEVGRKLGITWDEQDLRDSGFRKVRFGPIEARMDVGNIGPSYQPGHSHAEMFTFCLFRGNRSIVVNTGISTYERSRLRHLQRSTSAHNTVTINNQDQSAVWGSFRVGKRAKLFIVEDTPERIVAEHDGYASKYKLIHRRSFIKEGSSLTIEDQIIRGRKSSIHFPALFHLHLDNGCRVEWLQDDVFLIDNILKIKFLGAVHVSIEEYLQALQFNKTVSSKKILVSFESKLTTNFSS